jgi:hypothetical protein
MNGTRLREPPSSGLSGQRLKALGIRKNLILILFVGLAIRLALSWMPGTEDMFYFRMWGALALRSGMLHVYTWKDEDTLNAIFLKLRGIELHPRTANPTDLGPATGVPDYPPGNILIMKLAVGACKMLQGGTLRAGNLLNACLNLPPILFALAATLALWYLAQGAQAPRPLIAVAAFWLNPALILTSPVLGYQDPIFAAFGLLALMCFYRGRHTLSVLFLAASCLTKPQGVFIVPVLAAAFWAEGGWRALCRTSARFLLFLLVPLVPYIVTGRLLAPVAAFLRGAVFPALSAQTTNAWWLIGPGLQAIVSRSTAPLLGTLPMVPQSEFRALAGFDPLWLSLPALIAFTCANLYFLIQQLRAGNRTAIFWAAALEVYGYTMLALFVHENHLYAFLVYAAPLLASGKRPVVRVYWALSAIYGMNLFLFDGLGEGYTAPAQWLRTLPGFDLSILLGVVNVGVFSLIIRSRKWWFDRTQGLPPSPRI